jgi:hypothetical protein
MGTTAVILGIAATLAGAMVWTALLFPQPVAHARAVLERRPGRCFLTGIVLVVLLGVPVIVLMQPQRGLAKLAGWSLTFPLAVVLGVGLTAMADLLGERMRAMSPGTSALGGLVRGAVTLELVLALPGFGWFVFAPILGLTLLGAGALGSVPARRQLPSHREAESSEEIAHSLSPAAPLSASAYLGSD